MAISRRKAIQISGATVMGMSLARLTPAVGAQAPVNPRAGTRVSRRLTGGGKTDTIARQLARFVVNARFEDLPKPIVDAWTTTVLDAIAVGLVGSRDSLNASLMTVARTLGATNDCTVWNTTYRTDVSRAAWLNATMVGTPQGESSSHSHAAATVVPAILAIAERDHVDGRRFMAALILGAEVSARIQDSSTGVEDERGFHNPGIQGPFAAASAVGKLFGFDEEMMVNALGIAGSSSAGLQEYGFDGSDQKATHLGRAAQLGLESALLAQAGALGPATVFEGPFGYFNGFSLETDPHKAVENLTAASLGRPRLHKMYAVHTTHQEIAGTIVRFKSETPSFKATDLKHVTVKTTDGPLRERHMSLEPTTVMGAKYSTPFTIAVALHRDISDPLNYDESALADPQIRMLAKQIALVSSRDSGDRANGGTCEITLEMNDGARHVVLGRAQKGSGRNPFTFEDGAAKFRQWTRRVLDEKRQMDLIETVRGIAGLKDVGVLARALAAKT